MPTTVSKAHSSKVLSGSELGREALALLDESREEGERNAMSHDVSTQKSPHKSF